MIKYTHTSRRNIEVLLEDSPIPLLHHLQRLLTPMLIHPVGALPLPPLHLHNLPRPPLLVLAARLKRLRIPLRRRLRLCKPAQPAPPKEMRLGPVRIQRVVVGTRVLLRAPLKRKLALARLAPLLLCRRRAVRVGAHVPPPDLGRLGVLCHAPLLVLFACSCSCLC